MTTAKIDKYLKENMVWNSVDLFYAFCEAKGIEDPECDLTEEEYTAMEAKFQEKVNYPVLQTLVLKINEDVSERIKYAMKEVI